MKDQKKFPTLAQMVAQMNHKPDESIVHYIDNQTFPFSENLFYSYGTAELAKREYQRCYDLLNTRITLPARTQGMQLNMALMMEFQAVMYQIQEREKPHRRALEQIAINIVREIYGVPDEISILAKIDEPQDINLDEEIESQQNQVESTQLDPDRLEYVREEIQKRIILNGMVQGSAIHIWKSAYYIALEQIREIDPELVTLYNKYSALVSFMLWRFPVEGMKQMIASGQAMTQGYNKVEFPQLEEEEEKVMEKEKKEYSPSKPNEESIMNPTIKAYAINFPVLLHEISKGVIDYLISQAIPQDMSEEELQVYYAHADRYEDEFWHYLLSPTLWVSLLEVCDTTTQNLAQFISNLCELKYKRLAEVCKLIVHEPERAKIHFEILGIDKN